MIKKIQISNYKSIDTLDFELGRINVLIGENGAGKSNILEAIALAGAAAANKLDNEFLTSRGIRVTSPEYMRPAFPEFDSFANIFLKIESGMSEHYSFELSNENNTYSKWKANCKSKNISFTEEDLRDYLKELSIIDKVDAIITFIQESDKNEKNLSIHCRLKAQASCPPQVQPSYPPTGWKERSKKNKVKPTKKLISKTNRRLDDFEKNALFYKFIETYIIYSPENSALRTFQREGQIEPLGINGEGLLKLLSGLSSPEYSDSLNEIRKSLQILGWFEDITISEPIPFSGSRIEIKDRYLDETRRYFDQLSTNEGFLFLLFYFALFSTELTPQFFAIDNIDASLNPKLCEKLMLELVKKAEQHDKQVILTTHNPAILDGLNIDDDSQRLFVVWRNANGATRMDRVTKRKTPTGERPTRLSELFLRGILGGLPKRF